MALKNKIFQTFKIQRVRKGMPTAKVVTRDCVFEFSSGREIDAPWHWDDFSLLVYSARGRVSTYQNDEIIHEAYETSDQFTYIDYERETEEGHYTGPIYEKARIIITKRQFTLIDQNHGSSRPPESITCSL